MLRTSDQRAGKTAAVLRCSLTFQFKYGKFWTFYSCYTAKNLFCTGTSKLLQNGKKQMHWRACLLSTEQVTYKGLKWRTAALNHCNTNSTVTHLLNTLYLHMHIGKHCWNSRSSFTARAWRPACLLCISCKWSNCIGKDSPKQTSGPSCPRCKRAARISAMFTNVHVKMKCVD